jgi:hypothetical protein
MSDLRDIELQGLKQGLNSPDGKQQQAGKRKGTELSFR